MVASFISLIARVYLILSRRLSYLLPYLWLWLSQ